MELNNKRELHDTLEDKMARAAREDMLAYACFNLPYYDPQWFHQSFCKKLNDFAERRTKNLMIFSPPQVGKSELVSRCFPGYLLGKNPDARIIACSYSGGLATAMSRDVQKIMEGDRYRKVFPKTRIAAEGSREGKRSADQFEVIGARGGYLSAGVGAGITGRGADFMIIDDVIKNQMEADSPTIRERIWKWYLSTFLTRRRSKDTPILIMMTRWHEDDLAGRLLSEEADEWDVVSFPAIQDMKPTKLDRREIGEALWPEPFPASYLNKIKERDIRVFTAMYQQRPTAQEGNIVKREWIKRYDELPKRTTDWIQVWDLTFKGEKQRKGKGGSYVVGQVWCRSGADYYLVDQYRGRPDFPGTIEAIKRLTAKYPQALAKLIEDAANGPGVQATLKDSIPGIIAVPTKGASKTSRLHAVSVLLESGNVHFPPWADVVIEELLSFPNGVNDDQVDCITMALNRYKQKFVTGIVLNLDMGRKSPGVFG